MEDVTLIEKVAHLEERAKSNTRRIAEHDERIDSLEKTYSMLEKMDYRMGNVEATVEKMDKKLDTKVEEDMKNKGQKWDKLVDYIFYSILGVLLGFIAYKLGLN